MLTQDDIIRMAREAGLCTWVVPPQGAVAQLERFAALVAAAEREACAKYFEERSDQPFYGRHAAAATRARSQA